MRGAATLLGTITRLRELTGFEPFGATADELTTASTTAALALGESTFQEQWRKGYAASLDELLLQGLHDEASVSQLGEGVKRLSPREREVAELIGQGLTSGEIAERLMISAKTADVHADRIRTKLGLRSRAQIAAWATAQSLAHQTK
jgi:DNA-binding CsgD family transcriptional regulator